MYGAYFNYPLRVQHLKGSTHFLTALHEYIYGTVGNICGFFDGGENANVQNQSIFRTCLKQLFRRNLL